MYTFNHIQHILHEYHARGSYVQTTETNFLKSQFDGFMFASQLCLKNMQAATQKETRVMLDTV